MRIGSLAGIPDTEHACRPSTARPDLKPHLQRTFKISRDPSSPRKYVMYCAEFADVTLVAPLRPPEPACAYACTPGSLQVGRLAAHNETFS